MLAPLPHQTQAIDFIRERERGATREAPAAWALLDQMGLGKTLCLMYTIRSDIGTTDVETGEPLRTLIVVPACVRSQYHDRIVRYGISAIVSIVSYTSLMRGGKTAAAHLERFWHRVVLDEAHLIHNTFSRRSRACSLLECTIRGVLTGTPLLRKKSDLTTLASWLRISPSAFDAATLRRTYTDVDSTLPSTFRFPALRLYEHVYMRRSHLAKHEAAVNNSNYNYGMSFRVGERIASLRHTLVADKAEEGARNRGGQAAADAYSSKIDVVAAIASDASYHPSRNILVFTNFMKEHSSLLRLLGRTSERPIRSIHGKVPRRQREHIFEEAARSTDRDKCALLCLARLSADLVYTPCIVRKLLHTWLRPPGCVLVMQQETGSVGINLQMFATVIFANPTWCPMTDYQAMCRSHRMGQRSAVDAHWVYTNLGSKDYIDNSIYNCREKKIALFQKHISGDCALVDIERHVWSKHGSAYLT